MARICLLFAVEALIRPAPPKPVDFFFFYQDFFTLFFRKPLGRRKDVFRTFANVSFFLTSQKILGKTSESFYYEGTTLFTLLPISWVQRVTKVIFKPFLHVLISF